MSLAQAEIERIADQVRAAQRDARAIPMITLEHPDLDVGDGYAIQSAVQARYRAEGHRIIGWKAGLTSRAKIAQMGVDKPAVGFMTDRMVVPAGTPVPVADHVHPRVEAEVAFVLGADLPTSGCTVEHVLEATAFVVPAVEIIDSRFENFSFDLPSVIADNCSTARFALGSRGRRLAELDRRTLGVSLVINGEVAATGAAAAVWGDPAASVALVAELAGALGEPLRAGMTVLSGGITAAFAVSPGDVVSARFQDLGVVDVRFR